MTTFVISTRANYATTNVYIVVAETEVDAVVAMVAKLTAGKQAGTMPQDEAIYKVEKAAFTGNIAKVAEFSLPIAAC